MSHTFINESGGQMEREGKGGRGLLSEALRGYLQCVY